MNYTDTDLRQLLAKMLPEKLEWFSKQEEIWWKYPHGTGVVHDTELLGICRLVEEALTEFDIDDFCDTLVEQFGDAEQEGIVCYYQAIHATWQQKTIALANMKGIENV